MLLLVTGPLPSQGRSDSAGTKAPKPAPTRLQARVWVNASSHTYHCPGTRYYGKTQEGEYMSEAQARAKGNRAASGDACAPDAPSTAEGVVGAIRVWVNANSNVYHCPGATAYGKTRNGSYMTQSAAKAAGKRAAGGRDCK